MRTAILLVWQLVLHIVHPYHKKFNPMRSLQVTVCKRDPNEVTIAEIM